MNPLAFITSMLGRMLGRTRAAPEPAPTPVDPEPTITITVPASEKTAAAMERMHRMTSTPWTLTLTDATGEALTLSPRCGMTIDRADCLIIDDPAPERNLGAQKKNAAKWARRAASRRQGA
jgi:hypothetical protein